MFCNDAVRQPKQDAILSPLWKRGVIYTCYMLPQTFLRVVKECLMISTCSSKVEKYSGLL